jgi:hypothetical protein
MVWYLLRSTGVLRAAYARAVASEMGVPLRLAALSSLPPPVLLGVPPLPLAGEGGVGVPPQNELVERIEFPPPAALARGDLSRKRER